MIHKLRWNKDKCKYECRELVDKKKCDKGSIWNPSNCNCKCDKSCDIKEYLDFKNCKCKRKIVGELIKECSKNIEENEMIYNETLDVSLNVYKKVGNCTLYIALFFVFLVTITAISTVFIYIYWYSKKYYKCLLLIYMKNLRKLNIKNRQNYFFNNMINIKIFGPSLLSIDKISSKSIDSVIYDIKYFKNLNSAKFFYLIFNNADGYIEESNENNYLIFASTHKKKKH